MKSQKIILHVLLDRNRPGACHYHVTLEPFENSNRAVLALLGMYHVTAMFLMLSRHEALGVVQ